MQQVDFLDVTLNLQTDTFKPYKKPNSKTTYVHAESNPPATILKNIRQSVNRRINELSCRQEVFDQAKTDYNNALKECGYSERLSFVEEDRTITNDNTRTGRKNRKRKILWFNPPYNASVTTNIGTQFLNLIKNTSGKIIHSAKFSIKTQLKLVTVAQKHGPHNTKSQHQNPEPKQLNTHQHKNMQLPQQGKLST